VLRQRSSSPVAISRNTHRIRVPPAGHRPDRWYLSWRHPPILWTLPYREAAGWLAHAHTWIHPRDLGLRDAGLTGSYAAAALAGRLSAELPTMTARDSQSDVVPSDEVVAGALRLARLWRRLTEHRTWRPIADTAAVRETLGSLGWRVTSDDAAIDDWLDSRRDRDPALIRAGRGGRDWMNRQARTDPLAMDGLFLAACIWRGNGFGRDIPLPFWSAPVQLHHRLASWLQSSAECSTELTRYSLPVSRGSALDREK
jgi:hypothetical protein